MKKMVAMGLAVCMGVMSLSGCAGGSKNAAAGGEQTVAEQAGAGQAGSDQSGTGQAGTDQSGAGQAGSDQTVAGQDGTGQTVAGQTGADQAGADQTEAQKAASGLDKLVFTYVTSPLNVPTIIERNQNIFADDFGKMGISVEYAEINSGADQTQALASGDVQVLYAVGATSVILSAANGADIKVLNMYSRSPKAFSMYAKDDSLTSPESLKGKTIAGPAGTNLHELLAAYLATGGMTIQDVNYVNMSIPDAKAGLDGGSVDAALIAGATAYQAQQQGYHMVADGEGLIKAIIAVAVREDFYNENRDVIDRLMADQEKIAAFMRDNQEETLKIVAQELDLDEQAVKDMYACYDFSLDVSDEDRAGFQKTADFMLESGMIEEPFDVNTLFFQ